MSLDRRTMLKKGLLAPQPRSPVRPALLRIVQ